MFSSDHGTPPRDPTSPANPTSGTVHMAPDAEAPVGLRERKRRETETALRHATIELATVHGFDDVTVDQICAHVGVSSRTFFNYFASKEDAVLQARPSPPSGDQLDRFIAGGPDGGLVSDLAELVATHLEDNLPSASDLIRHHDLLEREPRLQSHFRGGLRDVEEGILQAIATRLGATADDLVVQVLAATVSGAMRVSIMRWVQSGGDPPGRAHVQATFDLLDNALDVDALT